MQHLCWAMILTLLPVTVSAAPVIGVFQFREQKNAALHRVTQQAVPGARVIPVSLEDFVAGRTPREVAVLVVPEAHGLPAIVGEPLQAWLQSRRGVVFVSEAIPLQEWLYQARGRWVSRQEALFELSTWRPLWQQLPSASAWRRNTDTTETASTWSLVDTPHGKGWQLSVAKLAGWCTYSLSIEQPFRAGEALISFWAKGDTNTRALSIEWRERDGSRWVATVPLSETWNRVTLSPVDFAYWQDNPSKGRGGQGDRLQPQNAVEVSIGLARSFASYPTNTPLSATISDLRVGKLTQPLPDPPSFSLEGIAPAYKWYTDSKGRLCSVVRYRGLGINGEAPGRRITTPLGDRACLFLSTQKNTTGSLWAWLPTSEANASNLAALLRPMVRGWYLLRAGTTQFSFWRGEPVQFGAEIANWRKEPVSLRLHAHLSSPNRVAIARELSLHLPPGARQRVLFPDTHLPEGEWRIRITATANDGSRDQIEHPFHVVGEPAAMPLVRVQNGHFVRDGVPFHAHGINFWPLWIAGQDRNEYWQHWLSPGQYDPDEVERALRIAKQVGFNILSVQYNQASQAPQLVDFLERARKHGMYVNLFVAAAHPFEFSPQVLGELIEAARIPQWDNIFAYDIAWEPHWGTHTDRKRHDAAWRDWIVEQYGSIENAEADWGYPLPREDGAVTNPTDEQILNDGAWRRMVAAYRRFLDDHVNRAYWRVVRFIRSFDGRHLIGARTGYGGNGSPWIDYRMPYDLLAGAPFFGFISPEGYSLSDNWQNFRAGGFITAYARWAGNGKPVFWAEFGASIYPQTTPERIAYQRNVYEWMYRMVEESRADGSAGWWFPGGIRVDENSDFGIIHPDGTLRPAARVAQQWASRLARLPHLAEKQETHAITIDRDLHPRGFSQVWARHRQEYLDAVEAGKFVEVRTEGTDTTTETVPLIAVGNVPCNGNNPPKYLNAQLLYVKAVRSNGETSDVEPDGSLPPDTVRLRVTVMNTGETSWSPPGKRRVFLSASWGAQAVVEQPVKRYEQAELDLPFSTSASKPYWLRMQTLTEDGRDIGFGQKWLLK